MSADPDALPIAESKPPGETGAESSRPTVLFLCVHNAGRSQMAAAWLAHLARERVTVLSGGSSPAGEVNPVAIAAMAEVGIDLRRAVPKPWTDEALRVADVVVTMGCGDTCPYVPGKRYEDWPVPDPAGQDLAAIRPIRNEIERRVRRLLTSLGIDIPPGSNSSDRRHGTGTNR